MIVSFYLFKIFGTQKNQFKKENKFNNFKEKTAKILSDKGLWGGAASLTGGGIILFKHKEDKQKVEPVQEKKIDKEEVLLTIKENENANKIINTETINNNIKILNPERIPERKFEPQKKESKRNERVKEKLKNLNLNNILEKYQEDLNPYKMIEDQNFHNNQQSVIQKSDETLDLSDDFSSFVTTFSQNNQKKERKNEKKLVIMTEIQEENSNHNISSNQINNLEDNLENKKSMQRKQESFVFNKSTNEASNIENQEILEVKQDLNTNTSEIKLEKPIIEEIIITTENQDNNLESVEIKEDLNTNTSETKLEKPIIEEIIITTENQDNNLESVEIKKDLNTNTSEIKLEKPIIEEIIITTENQDNNLESVEKEDNNNNNQENSNIDKNLNNLQDFKAIDNFIKEKFGDDFENLLDFNKTFQKNENSYENEQHQSKANDVLQILKSEIRVLKDNNNKKDNSLFEINEQLAVLNFKIEQIQENKEKIEGEDNFHIFKSQFNSNYKNIFSIDVINFILDKIYERKIIFFNDQPGLGKTQCLNYFLNLMQLIGFTVYKVSDITNETPIGQISQKYQEKNPNVLFYFDDEYLGKPSEVKKIFDNKVAMFIGMNPKGEHWKNFKNNVSQMSKQDQEAVDRRVIKNNIFNSEVIYLQQIALFEKILNKPYNENQILFFTENFAKYFSVADIENLITNNIEYREIIQSFNFQDLNSQFHKLLKDESLNNNINSEEIKDIFFVNVKNTSYGVKIISYWKDRYLEEINKKQQTKFNTEKQSLIELANHYNDQKIIIQNEILKNKGEIANYTINKDLESMKFTILKEGNIFEINSRSSINFNFTNTDLKTKLNNLLSDTSNNLSNFESMAKTISSNNNNYYLLSEYIILQKKMKELVSKKDKLLLSINANNTEIKQIKEKIINEACYEISVLNNSDDNYINQFKIILIKKFIYVNILNIYNFNNTLSLIKSKFKNENLDQIEEFQNKNNNIYFEKLQEILENTREILGEEIFRKLENYNAENIVEKLLEFKEIIDSFLSENLNQQNLNQQNFKPLQSSASMPLISPRNLQSSFFLPLISPKNSQSNLFLSLTSPNASKKFNKNFLKQTKTIKE